MENTTAKISFGFKKTNEKPNFLKNKVESAQETKKIELIDSIEGTQLKIHGKDPRDEEIKKLVIPMTNDQKTRPISKLIESRRIKKENGNGNAETPMEIDETLDQKAAREILEDLKNTTIKTENRDFEVPLHPDELPLNGAAESSLDDYERIQIADFGKAMLRGMGWKDEQEKNDPQKFDVPMVRPKGLGLGADKAIKKQKLLIQPAPNEVLEIKKRAFIKILAGKHKNMYGTIEGFDDGGGRLIIKLAIGGLKVLMNEFMVQPIPKQEFAKYSKILNSEKYEEFKNDENKISSAADKPVKVERRSRSISPSTSRARDDNKASKSRDEQIVSRGRGDENRRNKSQERERSKERSRIRSRERASNYYKKDKRHHSSDSEDDKTYNRKYNERQRSRSHDKHKRRHSSSASSSERHRSRKKSSKKSSKSKSKVPERYNSSDDERHHKRKYKRSKHHRDRS
ncbi:unnamed protein product [Chironomus riparius]|uniref:Spp2/MOS2 G-patch domain-containing protein n=1 Tax=Chironomus riparius TaxID=315576 RepID=A0A9N9WJ09_9DIPT|nr:unnamed protein product [Chironomus riparius]